MNLSGEIFKGISLRFPTENDSQYGSIGQFWDCMASIYSREELRGLGYNRTDNQIEYVIGRADNGPMKPVQIQKYYPEAVYKEVLLPKMGWQTYQGHVEGLSRLYGEIYKAGPLTYEIETFKEDGSCAISVCRELPVLEVVTEAELEKIIRLYKSALKAPGCVWNEFYPDAELLSDDIKHQSLFGIRDDKGDIIAAIAKDRDENVDKLPFWNQQLMPAAELSRLVVADKYKNQGLARVLILQAMKLFAERGFQAVHYLVATENEQAMRSYRALHFDLVGETDMFGHHYLCYEKSLF